MDKVELIEGQGRRIRSHGAHSVVCLCCAGAVVVMLLLGVTVLCVSNYMLRCRFSELSDRLEKLEKHFEGLKTGETSDQDDEDLLEPPSQIENEDFADKTSNGKSTQEFPDDRIDDESQEDGERSQFFRRKRRANEERGQVPKRPRTTKKPKPKALSAIHLHMMKIEPTSAERRVTTVDTYQYRAWRVADWATNERDYEYDRDAGVVKIKKKGLYFIYSQILYHNTATRSSYVIKINNHNFVKCMESVDAVMEGSASSADSARYKTCYTGGATVLNPGSQVSIHDLYSHPTSTDEHANFFGIIKFADLE